MSDTPRTDAYIKQFPGCLREPKLLDFCRRLEKQLTEARAEIERLKRENIELLVKCDEKFDVIDRKDKLIEQMREALKFSLIADEVRQTRNVCASDINDACETSRIKRIAALSAAERGE